MKRVKIKPLHCILSLIAVVLLLGATLVFSACSDVSSHEGDGGFHYEEYGIDYNVSADGSMQVTETITVSFDGRDCTRFVANIPVSGGELVKNINVTEVTEEGVEKAEFYVLIDDHDYISVNIGDSSKKYKETHTYVLTYEYCITRAQKGKNFLQLTPIEPDRDFEIANVSVTIILPTECLRAEYYVGDSEVSVEYGKNISTVTLSGISLESEYGLTLIMEFEDGVLSTYFDFTPYLFVIIAAAILIILILLKLLVFNKNNITPIVNFEAPFGMDPLMMGKLIDNTVNAEDVTALIFYWADKGYLRIDLDDEDNPTLIRIKNLPETAADYERIVFNGLFQKSESVKTKDLKNVFYRTFERAKTAVNSLTKGLHKSWSIGLSILFVLLSGLLIGLAPIVLGMATISSSLAFPYGFIALIPALILYGFSESVKYNRLKRKGKRNALYYSLLALGILACSGVFVLVIPSSLLSIIPKFLLCALSFITATASVLLISRTPDYNEKLNHIVGFRNFLKSAEKDRLEELLANDPQYYYHVLPYAQVLNVDDIWAEKFKEITVEPPAWATSSSFNMFDFIILNDVINHSMRSITTGMIARPSSSGAND